MWNERRAGEPSYVTAEYWGRLLSDAEAAWKESLCYMCDCNKNEKVLREGGGIIYVRSDNISFYADG